MISHRPAMSIDRNFICKSWLASYRDSNSAGMIQVDDWHSIMFQQVEKILALPDVQTVIAYEDRNPDHATNAYGFIVADTADKPPLVWYVFVKTAYRRSGIARGLLNAIGLKPTSRFNYACQTPIVISLSYAQKLPLAQWAPMLGRQRKSERRNPFPLRRTWRYRE